MPGLGAASARRFESAATLAGYLLVAFVFLGLRPLVAGGHHYVGYTYDPQIFIWALAWWPHAILHGQNPFVTHAIWAPDGVNLDVVDNRARPRAGAGAFDATRGARSSLTTSPPC